jgi:hypothetical protein
MKTSSPLRSLLLLCVAILFQLQQGWAATLLLPPPPNNDADGFIQVTWGGLGPSGGVYGEGLSPEFSFLTTDIQATPTPPIPAARYATWCLDTGTQISPGGEGYSTPGTLYGGALISSQDPNLNSYLPDHPNVKKDAATWNRINWLINHRRDPLTCPAFAGVTATMWEVQTAITALLGQPNPTFAGEPTFRQGVVDCLVAAATDANTSGWVPNCGDKVAVIYNIDVNWDNNAAPDVQLLFLEVPFVCVNPCVTLVKTADVTTAANGAQVGYTYTVTNCGNTVFNNLAIIDDAGTPDYPGDDFTVASGINLNPGDSQPFHVVVTLPVPECSGTGGTGPSAGTLITQILPNGDVKVTFRQSRNLNDNVYGSTAITSADGWSGGHTFGNLTGSDKAEFRFTDGKGNVVLDFYQDYVSATTVSPTYPSGYASLGPFGGDGSWITGGKTNVLWWTSTLADSLNNTPGSASLYTVNSPTPEGSVPTWDYVDGYTVLVSHLAFGANGFGGVTIPYVHNSPAKTGNNQVSPTPCGACIENIARLVTVDGQNKITSVLATDNAVVCTGNPAPPPPVCLLTEGALKIDKNTIQVPIKNNGSAAVYLTELDLTWPQATNGKLKKVSLNGDVWVSTTGSGSPVSLTSGFTTDPNKRKIDKGQTKTLVLQFEKNADKVASHYSGGTVKFGTDSSCSITFLP